MAKLVVCLFALIFSIFFHPSVFADASVVINEFYALGSGDDPDWVELYNQSESNINLEGWLIRDETESNKISLSGYICGKSFRKFEFSNRLNNSGDKIRLFDSESASAAKDEITYFSSEIPTHAQGQSTSRDPDGASYWVLMTSPTPSDNNSCTPQPSPSSTPSPTPTSTSQSSTSTKSPTPTPKPSATPAKSAQPSPLPTPNSVLGTKTEEQLLLTSTPEASPAQSAESEESKGSSKTKIAAMLTGSGVILIGLSIGFFVLYNRTLNKEDNKKESKDIN